MPYYGGHGKFTAKPGERDNLLSGLLQAADLMRPVEGCLLYIVSISPSSPDDVLVTEMWTSKEAHDDSLNLESVQALIPQVLPFIAGPSEGVWFEPVGGKGL
jgi:quinol monooxygenase YgiN